ncbi:hypothetical protein V9T40_013030 [Parthenolecanium corni]|uniref:Uncharacterized protein n=1 Tax=Parthenolecanium corni TaxID=536013 RepID=A0AAN9T9W6_9HEMI
MGAKNVSNSTGVTATSHGQYKIHSLEQNTVYEIEIRPYGIVGFSGGPCEKNYSLEVKTNRKLKTKPTKPDLEMITPDNLWLNTVGIKWLPCGRDRNCSEMEAGAYFAIKFRALDRREELKILEYENAYYYTHGLLVGIPYEVTVISIYDELETESDPQEIILQPRVPDNSPPANEPPDDSPPTTCHPDNSLTIICRIEISPPDEQNSHFMFYLYYFEVSEATTNKNLRLLLPRSNKAQDSRVSLDTPKTIQFRES